MRRVKFYQSVAKYQGGYIRRPNWLIARLREPSTYQGIALLGGLFGKAVDVNFAMEIGVGIAGAISVLLPENNEQ